MGRSSPLPVPLRRRSLLALALSAPMVMSMACVAPPAEAGQRLIQVQVVDRDSGRVLSQWRDHGGPIVAGRPGARYAVRLTNVSGERVLAVLAIDGVNVITGETASPLQRGYVFGPGESYDITGWRKSDAEVAAFEFTALSDSYAARTGRPLDVGVIGVAVFREAQRPVPEVSVESDRRRDESFADARAPSPVAAQPAAPSAMAKAAPGATAAAADNATSGRASRIASSGEPLGTGHGARETSWSTRVDFERATSQPAQLVRVRYDSYERLVASGVIPRRAPPPPPGPRAFPADPNPGYVPDPPTW